MEPSTKKTKIDYQLAHHAVWSRIRVNRLESFCFTKIFAYTSEDQFSDFLNEYTQTMFITNADYMVDDWARCSTDFDEGDDGQRDGQPFFLESATGAPASVATSCICPRQFMKTTGNTGTATA